MQILQLVKDPQPIVVTNTLCCMCRYWLQFRLACRRTDNRFLRYIRYRRIDDLSSRCEICSRSVVMGDIDRLQLVEEDQSEDEGSYRAQDGPEYARAT
jgi:hypothetical protein